MTNKEIYCMGRSEFLAEVEGCSLSECYSRAEIEWKEMNKDEMIKDIERTLIECCHFINENNGLSYTKCVNCEYWDDTNNECASYERKQALAIFNAGYRKEQETAREILQEMFGYFGSYQKFCIVDDEHKTLIDLDGLWAKGVELAKKYGIDME